MKFNEAMECLQKGDKVTRTPWIGSVYFMLEENDVKAYQPRLGQFIYDEDIMISDGWSLGDVEGNYRFYDIIPYLQSGASAKRNDWKNSYIYLDKQTKSLVIHTMDVFPFVPDFAAFIAEDWVNI